MGLFSNYVITKRLNVPVWLKIITPVIAIFAAMLIGSIFIAYAGANPLQAYFYILKGALGSMYSITETLVTATPFLFTGLAVAVAFTAKFWNIGMEGQLYAGGLASVWVALSFPELSSVILISLSLIAGFIAGGLWGMLAGYLKERFGANEVVTTIMLNYIMIFIIDIVLEGPWRNPITNWPQSPLIPREASLPIIMNRTRLHLGVIIAVVCAVLVYILLTKTSLGYKIKAIGESHKAARYAGINISRTILLMIFISGGLAGLAGTSQVLGVHQRLIREISSGYGYSGVMIGLLGRLNPFGVILASVFFAALITGSGLMQRMTGVPTALADILQGLALIMVLAGNILVNYQIKRRASSESAI
ncbi:MAG: ABC transporter permease [Halanaerobium sp.]|nr:ABC transporter permease [Halanaerobium sp.]